MSTWVAQSRNCLPLAQVIMAGSWARAHVGSLLLPLPRPPPPLRLRLSPLKLSHSCSPSLSNTSILQGRTRGRRTGPLSAVWTPLSARSSPSPSFTAQTRSRGSLGARSTRGAEREEAGGAETGAETGRTGGRSWAPSGQVQPLRRRRSQGRAPRLPRRRSPRPRDTGHPSGRPASRSLRRRGCCSSAERREALACPAWPEATGNESRSL